MRCSESSARDCFVWLILSPPSPVRPIRIPSAYCSVNHATGPIWSIAKTKGAEVLVAPCHNCHSGLHDIVHHYEIGLDIKFFGDIIYEVMEKPE